MAWRCWTKVEVPAAPIFWVSSYFIEVDAMLAVPIFEHSKAAKAAIERGLIHPITREKAQEMNETFAAEGDHAVKFLEEILEGRWKVIACQHQECIAGG